MKIFVDGVPVKLRLFAYFSPNERQLITDAQYYPERIELWAWPGSLVHDIRAAVGQAVQEATANPAGDTPCAT